MDPDDSPWDGRFDRDAFVANRVAYLAKALTNHTVWKRALDGAGEGAGLAVAWVDHEGGRHETVVDRAFMRTHLAIVRSLMADLSGCGDVGTFALRGVFARQLNLLDDGEVG
jgi:hypothetical protein